MSSRDRDEVFLELTRSICPVCKTAVAAEVNARDDQVFLRKRCVDHGEFEARVYGDAKMYIDIQRFNKPGTRPLQTQTVVKDGCPSDCGLCPEHKQHACLGVIEVQPLDAGRDSEVTAMIDGAYQESLEALRRFIEEGARWNDR